MLQVMKNMHPEFIDERGGITKILDDGTTVLRSVLLISSKKGSVRANHYHKKDAHYAYLLSGRMEYTEAPVDAPESRESIMLEAGDMVLSLPMTIHRMRFLEDSVFLALATKSRAQEDYEADTVRVTLSDH